MLTRSASRCGALLLGSLVVGLLAASSARGQDGDAKAHAANMASLVTR